MSARLREKSLQELRTLLLICLRSSPKKGLADLRRASPFVCSNAFQFLLKVGRHSKCELCVLLHWHRITQAFPQSAPLETSLTRRKCSATLCSAKQGIANKDEHEQPIEAVAPKLLVRTFGLGKARPSSNGSAEVLDDQALPISCGR